jgi:hypothetical protein
VGGLYFAVGFGAVCWNIANLHYLPKISPADERALFVSVHGAVTACIGGCAPILWGFVLKSLGPGGAPAVDVGLFQWFFASVVAGACVLSVLIARLHEDTKTHVDPIIIGNAVLNPFRAASYLVNLIDAKGIVREVVPSRSDRK